MATLHGKGGGACINYAGMNALRQGVTAACAVIDKIIASVREATNITSDISSISNDISHLNEIKEIILLPSKYDTIVVCLQPCLSTGHLEDANHSCLQEKDCMQYGFRQLWSNGLWKTLFCEV